MIEIRIQSESAGAARAMMAELIGRVGDAPLGEGTTNGGYVEAPAGVAGENPVERNRPTADTTEAAPAKRTRRTKAEIEAEKAAQAKAVASNISTTPEDRQDPEAGDEVVFPEEEKEPDFFDDETPGEADDMIDGYAVTDEGLKAVMHAYVAKFDMAAAQANAKTLFGGYTKRSEVTAAGEAALATAIRNFSTAINTGKAA